jgi:hypothetical protein
MATRSRHSLNHPPSTIPISYFKELMGLYVSGGKNFVSRKQKMQKNEKKTEKDESDKIGAPDFKRARRSLRVWRFEICAYIIFAWF